MFSGENGVMSEARLRFAVRGSRFYSRRWMSTHEDVGNWADSPWKERQICGARERASFDRVQQQPSSFNVTIFAVNAFFVRARHRYPVG